MNITTLLGLVMSMIVFISAIFMSLKNAWVFFELNSVLIVVGGTTAATLVCFPLKQILSLFKVFVRRLMGQARHDYMGITDELVQLSGAYRKGARNFERQIEVTKHLFLRDAANVLFWIESEVSHDEIRTLLETRAETHFTRYMSEARIFRTISKFPPAFGLMGTTLGMVALLQSLGGEDAIKLIGPAMAIALVTTLWGLALANFIFTPIAENLIKQTEEDLVARRMIVEGVLLIALDKPTKYVEEMAKSFLLPSERGESASSKKPPLRKAS